MEKEVYLLELIHHQLALGETQGLASWVEAFVSALNELDLALCDRLLRLAKQHYMSSAGTATIRFNEALVQAEHHNWDAALFTLKTCLEIRQSLSDRVGCSEAFFQIGRVHRQTSQYVKARGALLESLAISEALKDPSRISTCLTELAQLYDVQSEYDAAKHLYVQSIELDNTEWRVAQSRYRLGLIDQLKGDYTNARSNYESVK